MTRPYADFPLCAHARTRTHTPARMTMDTHSHAHSRICTPFPIHVLTWQRRLLFQHFRPRLRRRCAPISSSSVSYPQTLPQTLNASPLNTNLIKPAFRPRKPKPYILNTCPPTCTLNTNPSSLVSPSAFDRKVARSLAHSSAASPLACTTSHRRHSLFRLVILLSRPQHVPPFTPHHARRMQEVRGRKGRKRALISVIGTARVCFFSPTMCCF